MNPPIDLLSQSYGPACLGRQIAVDVEEGAGRTLAVLLLVPPVCAQLKFTQMQVWCKCTCMRNWETHLGRGKKGCPMLFLHTFPTGCICCNMTGGAW